MDLMGRHIKMTFLSLLALALASLVMSGVFGSFEGMFAAAAALFVAAMIFLFRFRNSLITWKTELEYSDRVFNETPSEEELASRKLGYTRRIEKHQRVAFIEFLVISGNALLALGLAVLTLFI